MKNGTAVVGDDMALRVSFGIWDDFLELKNRKPCLYVDT
jgi:hypothetical protein